MDNQSSQRMDLSTSMRQRRHALRTDFTTWMMIKLQSLPIRDISFIYVLRCCELLPISASSSLPLRGDRTSTYAPGKSHTSNSLHRLDLTRTEWVSVVPPASMISRWSLAPRVPRGQASSVWEIHICILTIESQRQRRERRGEPGRKLSRLAL